MHREIEDQQVYAMVIGKGGLKIKEVETPKPRRRSGTQPGVTGQQSVASAKPRVRHGPTAQARRRTMIRLRTATMRLKSRGNAG